MHVLVDGGYVNNLPTDVMRAMGASMCFMFCVKVCETLSISIASTPLCVMCRDTTRRAVCGGGGCGGRRTAG